MRQREPHDSCHPANVYAAAAVVVAPATVIRFPILPIVVAAVVVVVEFVAADDLRAMQHQSLLPEPLQ